MVVEVPLLGGYIRRAVMWHLMEDGVLDMTTLRERTGAVRQALVQATSSLRKKQLVAYVQPAQNEDRRTRHFGLTKSGIEMALRIDRSDFENPSPFFKEEKGNL